MDVTDTKQTDRDLEQAVWAAGRWSRLLADNWSLRPVDEFAQGFYPRDVADWQPTQVPGHWQLHPGLEQHTGRVVYRCDFNLDELQAQPTAPDSTWDGAGRRYWLRFNGAFYWSQPYLNGVDLGRHEGYFLPYEREVTDWLESDNTLLVEVDCPEERNKFGKRMITGVFSHWDCLDPHANPGGIWLPVELQQSGPVRLQAVRCHTESFNEQFAQLRYTAEVDAATAGSVLVCWTITPRNFAGPAQRVEQRRMLRDGFQEIHGLFKLRDPQLWWTHDLGDPNLYTITLEVLRTEMVSDIYSFSFGVRHFEMRHWVPYLNGVRFLIKGSNYAPGDMRIATMNAERSMRDMHLARECHMNLLRVHAHVDHPTLYEAANAAGVLLWQDFPLQWLYHSTILPEAQRQVRAMVHLLYNHPSIVIWCMHNEPVFVGDTKDESLRTRLRTYQTAFGFSWNRDVMDTRLKQVVSQTDPQRIAVRSSGELHVPRLRAGTDAHIYFGWYSAYGTLHDGEVLRQRFVANIQFVTEFGAQSFPNVESCVKFMPADITEIDVDHLLLRHSFQPDIMGHWIDWRAARSLEELVTMTQDYQIFVNRFYIDRLRYHKYRPTGGIVPFMFCDSYPAVLWSIIDYWRVPKRSYTAMQMAFSPQYAFTLIPPRVFRVAQPIDIPLYVVNDAQEPVHGLQLYAQLRAPDGAELAEVQHTLTLDADCLAREMDRLRLTPTQPGNYTLEVQLTGGMRKIEHVYQIEVA